MHDFLLWTICGVIIVIQLTVLRKTRKKAKLFSTIFEPHNLRTYSLLSDEEENICGFCYDGPTNPYFDKITESINAYVEENKMIEFQLIKDIVEGVCDAQEEDVHSQIPLPLYLGLVGTMSGILVGVASLLWTGELTALLTTSTQLSSGGEGITALLRGVAIAMSCSIMGLIITTWLTWLFKGKKLTVEEGKSAFFTWLQQNLLPEVATDDLQAIGKIAGALKRFNATFKAHSDGFSLIMNDVHEAVKRQETLARRVEEMEERAVRVSEANARATHHLALSADKLENFSNYINSIEGYTDAIRQYTEKFKDETLRLQALEEIRDFFMLEKAQIQKRNQTVAAEVAQFDNDFRGGMKELKTNMEKEAKELQGVVAQHTTFFQESMTEHKKLFEAALGEITQGMQTHLQALPKTVAALNTMATIPEQVNKLIEHIEKENERMLSLFRQRQGEQEQQFEQFLSNHNSAQTKESVPGWLQILVVVGVVLIAVAVLFSSYNTWRMANFAKEAAQADTVASMQYKVDSVPSPPMGNGVQKSTGSALSNSEVSPASPSEKAVVVDKIETPKPPTPQPEPPLPSKKTKSTPPHNGSL